jgi:hypothetical protein
MTKLIQSEHTTLISPRMPSLVKSPFSPSVKGESTKRERFAFSLAGFVCLMSISTLALAHGGMGPDEIGPPIMTSGLIGFVSYWAVMLWPSARKNTDQTVGVNEQDLYAPHTERRPKKRSARVKRVPRLRKIEGTGQFDSAQHPRRKASDG